ncbi:hypothetical protein T03_13185 [Trichinella britovi]|uniref:Uncharacterized protein n=1 Tax=Trichinella britovi TaxID=45882 RepID=A0A0V1AJ71_TRIBR|nr:hypothetical protein T03_13185 [Trichinella britovi]
MAYYHQSSDALAEWLAVVPTVPWPWRTRHRWNSRSFPEASPLHSGNGRSRSNATICSYDFIVWSNDGTSNMKRAHLFNIQLPGDCCAVFTV